MSQPKTPERRWLVLVAMTGSLSMIMLDATILGVALPTIDRDLHFTAGQQTWAVNGYLVAMASWIVLGGRLGDRLGRMRAFRLGVIGFALASIACALAPSAWVFIAARVAQGICAATMQPASAAIVVDLYPPEQRGRAMATYAGISLLFLAAGALVGGVIVEEASWHWCFGINVPIAIVAIVLTLLVRWAPPRGQVRPIDWPSIPMLLVGMPVLMTGLQSVRDARGAFGPIILTLGGVLLLLLFVRRQLRLPAPTIDLRLLSDRGLVANALILFAFQFINTGQGIYGVYYMQTVLGFTPMESGLGTLPLLVPVLLVVHVAGRLYDRIGPRRPILIGVSLALAGTIVESIGVAMLSYPTLAAGMFLLGTGCGFAMSPTNADALSRAPGAQRGEVSGLVQAFRQFGSACGIALFVLAMQIVSPAAADASWSSAAIAAGFVVQCVIALAALLLAMRWAGSPRLHPSTPTT